MKRWWSFTWRCSLRGASLSPITLRLTKKARCICTCMYVSVCTFRLVSYSVTIKPAQTSACEFNCPTGSLFFVLSLFPLLVFLFSEGNSVFSTLPLHPLTPLSPRFLSNCQSSQLSVFLSFFPRLALPLAWLCMQKSNHRSRAPVGDGAVPFGTPARSSRLSPSQTATWQLAWTSHIRSPLKQRAWNWGLRSASSA